MREMRCKQCGANEDRINGFCSVECEEFYRLEEEIGEQDNVILERGAEIGRLNARIAELEKALNIDTDLTIAGLRKELRDATARIAELEAAHRWRVVANGELPEEDGEYWVWFDDEFTGIKISGYCDYCDYSKQNGWDDTERVTHWMPLPEPPEVQE